MTCHDRGGKGRKRPSSRWSGCGKTDSGATGGTRLFVGEDPTNCSSVFSVDLNLWGRTVKAFGTQTDFGASA